MLKLRCVDSLLSIVLFIVLSQPLGAGEEPLTPEAAKAVEELRASLPKDSEAIAMLENILSGSRLGPGEGWFRVAVAQSRFDWEYVLKTYDADDNGEITGKEFDGTAHQFARLDRNNDQKLTAADFDWSTHSLSPTPGYMAFFRADRDANGKVTQEELIQLFSQLDTDEQGYLSLDDLRDQFQAPDPRERETRPDRPSPSTLVLALQRQEIGSLQSGPALNERAPDFTLTTLQGKEVTLSQEIGEKPIVLIFGNFTCGPFRSQSGNLEKLAERYKDEARFFLVYVREAHPKEGWWMISNQSVGIDVPQPTTNEERVKVAQTCQQHLNLTIPFLVDTVDDQVGATYSGMPNRLYLIDQEGKIAFKNGRGPFGFHPRQLEQNLILLLAEQQNRKE